MSGREVSEAEMRRIERDAEQCSASPISLAERGRWREWMALRIAPWLLNDRKNWWAVVKVNYELKQLLIKHHAVGAMDGALIGDTCRVCARAGVLDPAQFVDPLPTEPDPRLVGWGEHLGYEPPKWWPK